MNEQHGCCCIVVVVHVQFHILSLHVARYASIVRACAAACQDRYKLRKRIPRRRQHQQQVSDCKFNSICKLQAMEILYTGYCIDSEMLAHKIDTSIDDNNNSDNNSNRAMLFALSRLIPLLPYSLPPPTYCLSL